EFSTALLRGLIRDESIRAESPLGVRTEIDTAGRSS
ncbi:MAG: TetR/AcrR family transcriptional regulator, partial [Mycobacterium sp.]